MSSNLLRRLIYYAFLSILMFVFSSNIAFTQSCDAPFAQSPDSVTTNSAKLQWISSVADTFDIELIADTTALYEIATGSSFTWQGLSPATDYTFRVRAVCNGVVSSWSNLVRFSTHLTNPTNCAVGLDIPNASCNYSNDFYMDVVNAPGQALGVDVVLDEVKVLIGHTYNQDLTLSLIAPDGTTIILSERNGFEFDNYGNPYDTTCQSLTIFADDYCAPGVKEMIATTNDSTNYIGVFRPEQPLALLNATGVNPNGVWKLRICDAQISDFGMLEYFELGFAPVACAAPVSPGLSLVGGSFGVVDWELANSADSVYIEYGLTDFVPGTDGQLGGGDTIIRVSGLLNDVSLLDLVPSSKYFVYLRARCGNSYSTNTCFYFSTDCADPSFVTNFDDLGACAPKCDVVCDITGTWRNGTDDDNDWVVRTGKTPSFNTGPDADVSGMGNYIYTETSYPCGTGALAVLQSNCVFIGDDVTENCAFSFQAHMKGSKIGALRLLAHTMTSNSWDTLWVATGAQGSDWQKHYVDLANYSNQTIQLRFEGVRGGSTGDIALDELTFYGNTLDLGPSNVFYLDSDGDGFGNPEMPASFCGSVPPIGYVSNSYDCTDSNNAIHPSAQEIKCNQIDENCNGISDDSILDNPYVNSVFTVCDNESNQLFVSDPPVGNFYWYSNTGQLLANGQSVTIPNLVNGQTIFVIDSMSNQGYVCVSDLVQIDVVIQPSPNIGVDTIIPHCSGDPFLLSSLVVEEINGQEIFTDIYGALPYVDANIIASDSIYAEQYSTLYLESSATNGCSATKNINFQILASPVVGIFPVIDTFELCPNEFEVLQAGVIQGVAPYIFNWSNGFESQIAFAQTTSTANDYSTLSVVLTDSTGCLSRDTVVIGNNAPVTNIQINNLQDVSTCGGSDGQFEIVPQGGIPPYHISWDGPTSGDVVDVLSVVANNLTQGAYRIEITDSSPGACAVSFSGIIINAPGLSVSLDTVINVSCYSSNDGSILLDVIGNGSTTYLWSDNVTTQDRAALSQGAYSVTITDAGCSLTLENIIVEEPDVIQIFVATQEDISCFGAADGVVELNVFGGVKPYNFNWTGPMTVTGDSINSLVPGNYNCEVQDANGCLMGPIQVMIDEPDSLGFVMEKKDVLCHGDESGEIIITPFGGTGTYSYAWNDSLLVGRINQHLDEGFYSCTLKDANGCEVTDHVTISSPQEIGLISLDKVHPTCLGLENGRLEAFGEGGVGSLSYYWAGFTEGALIENLLEDGYQLIIKDSIGCVSDTFSTNLSYVQHINLAIDSIQPVSCNGFADGSIAVFAVGGHFPLQYGWAGGEMGKMIDGQPADFYSVSVIDDIGCKDFLDSIELTQPDSLLLDVLADPVQCYGEASGSVFGYQIGGVAPYSYSWNTGDTISDLAGVYAGLYQLTVTDKNNCQQFAEAIVPEPDTMITTVGHIGMVATCGQGASLGSITLAVEGGVMPYSYDWSNHDTTQNIYSLDTGAYSCMVSDFNGCIVDVKPITIFNSDLDFEVVPFLLEDIRCNSIYDGQIIGEGIGGTMPYNFNWSNGNTSSNIWLETPYDTIQGLSKGKFNLTITDSKGCTTVSDSFQIEEPSLFHVDLDSVRHNPCGTLADGQIFTTSSGGIPPYHYLWNTLSFDEDPDSLSVGTYTVTVVDGNDCLASLLVPVTLESLINDIDIELDSVIHQHCSNLGAIDISIPTTIINPQFLWSTSDTTEDLTSLFPGFYSLTVTEANGCTNSIDSIEITSAPNALDIVLDSIYNVSCYGGSDGVLGVSLDGGIPPLTYYWSSSQNDSLSINGLASGTYSVTIVDGNSCVAISSGLNVGEPPAIHVEATITDAMITQNGQILLDITGGIAPMSIQWDASANHQVTNPATNLPPGDYSVSVTDHNGCELIINDLTVGGVTGVGDFSTEPLQIFPNPNDGSFLINWPSRASVSVSILSPIGLRFAPTVLPQGDQLSVQILDIPDGVYVVELTQKNGLKQSGLISIQK